MTNKNTNTIVKNVKTAMKKVMAKEDKKVKISNNTNTPELNNNITIPPPVYNNSSNKRYVVVRSNFRVSDVEYNNPDDQSAISEMEFWKKIANQSKDGTLVQIVEYDEKKHRIWNEN